MCDDRDRQREGRELDPRDRDQRFERGRDGFEGDVDSVKSLKNLVFKITDDAFTELVHDRAKQLLQEKAGDKIDSIAESVVDYFLKMREREVEAVLDGEEFDRSFASILKKGD